MRTLLLATGLVLGSTAVLAQGNHPASGTQTLQVTMDRHLFVTTVCVRGMQFVAATHDHIRNGTRLSDVGFTQVLGLDGIPMACEARSLKHERGESPAKAR